MSAKVPAGVMLSLGDDVEVSPAHCKDKRVPTVIQVLSAKPPSAVEQ